jgi:hypothetical protein
MGLSLALFRHNQSFTLALLVIIILFQWIPLIMYPISIEYNGMPLFNPFQWISFQFPYIASILSFILLISQGIYLNILTNRYDLTIRQTYFPSLVFILIAGLFPDFRNLNPSLLAGIFILAACDQLLGMHKQKNVDHLAFNSSFLIAIASLISLQTLLFYVLVIVSLIIFRPFSWREFLVSLSGLMVPYIFLITWLIISDNGYFTGLHFLNEHNTSLIITNKLHINITGCIVLFITLIAYWKVNSYLNSTIVKIKKGYTLLNWMAVLLFTFFLISNFNATSIIVLMSIPFSVILSNYFLLSAKSLVAELLFILLLIVSSFIQINYLYHII